MTVTFILSPVCFFPCLFFKTFWSDVFFAAPYFCIFYRPDPMARSGYVGRDSCSYFIFDLNNVVYTRIPSNTLNASFKTSVTNMFCPLVHFVFKVNDNSDMTHTPWLKVIIAASSTCTLPYEGTDAFVTEPLQSEIIASIRSKWQRLFSTKLLKQMGLLTKN